MTIHSGSRFATLFQKALVKNDPAENQYYLLLFTAAMFNIRYISFCCEWCQAPRSGLRFAFIDMLCYTFYVPTLFTGPIMTYDQFDLQVGFKALFKMHVVVKRSVYMRDVRSVSS